MNIFYDYLFLINVIYVFIYADDEEYIENVDNVLF